MFFFSLSGLQSSSIRLVLMLLIPIILISMLGWFNHKPIKLPSVSYHHFPDSNLSVTALVKTVSLQKSYRTDLSQAQVLCFDQTINKIPGLAFSFSVKYAGTSLERHACHKFRTQEHIIDLINGSIFSLLTLFVLVHISILIVNIVYVLLDMCFDSNKSKYTCNKLSPQFFQNGTKNTNTILTYSECIEMLLPFNLHDSNVKFNCLMAVIIIVPYIVGICRHFPNQSKDIFIIAVRKLIVFLQMNCGHLMEGLAYRLWRV